MVDQTAEKPCFPNTWIFCFKYNSYPAYLKSKKMKSIGTSEWKKKVKRELENQKT